MTKSLTARLLILALTMSFLPSLAEAYSCAKNHSKWTRKQVLESPLDLYERLAQRDQSTLRVGDLAVIRTDLQNTKRKLKSILGEKAKPWIEQADQLLKDNVPHKKLLEFYGGMLVELQIHFKSGEASDNLGYMSTLETVREMISQAEGHRPGGLPVIYIPIHGDLTMGNFVSTNATPLYFAGITFKPRTPGDGVVFGPADFYIHDLFHGELMSLFLRNTFRDIPDANPMELIRKWNQLANSKLNQDTEAPMFFQMHEQAEVIR